MTPVYYSKSGDDKAVKGDLPMLAQIIRDAVDIDYDVWPYQGQKG